MNIQTRKEGYVEPLTIFMLLLSAPVMAGSGNFEVVTDDGSEEDW